VVDNGWNFVSGATDAPATPKLNTRNVMAQVNKSLAPAGVKIRYSAYWEEYVVMKSGATYHASDLEDAIGTARLMASETKGGN
jgi:hypothetical protein